jgi:hypothetical protein
MAGTEELSDFQHGTIIECHLSNKSVYQISALLELGQVVAPRCFHITITALTVNQISTGLMSIARVS